MMAQLLASVNVDRDIIQVTYRFNTGKYPRIMYVNVRGFDGVRHANTAAFFYRLKINAITDVDQKKWNIWMGFKRLGLNFGRFECRGNGGLGLVLLRDISCTSTIALPKSIPPLPAPEEWYKRIYPLHFISENWKKNCEGSQAIDSNVWSKEIEESCNNYLTWSCTEHS